MKSRSALGYAMHFTILKTMPHSLGLARASIIVAGRELGESSSGQCAVIRHTKLSSTSAFRALPLVSRASSSSDGTPWSSGFLVSCHMVASS
eukprot:COSAG02_NODE_2451_length_8826_cov_26.741836_2_plen_92_part_00